MAQNNNLKGIVYLFIGVIIALPLLLSISGLISPMSEYQTDTDNFTIQMNGTTNVNESYVYELEYGDAVYDNDESIKNLELTNGTDTLTETTDYTQNLTAGTFQLKNTTATYTADNVIATYEYQSKDYIDYGFSRTIIGLIVGFFALAILVFVVAKLLGFFNNEGVR